MNTLVLALDFSKICRICLLEYDSMFSIYSELLEQNTEEKMPTIFQILASISNINIQDDESLPNMICAKCIDSANNAYKFQQQCNRSQSLLEFYLEQIKVLHVENDCLQLKASNSLYKVTSDKEDFKKILENSNSILEDNLLPVGLNFINDDYLPDKERKDTDENDDCDDLKSCLPLGEDTVDELIKDNFKVENLEMISPKMSFNLQLQVEDDVNCKPSSNNEKTSIDVPSMNYYKTTLNDGTLVYSCNICNKSFKLANHLRGHLKSHDEKKPYVCTECKKSFKVYSSLKHHIRSHSGEQPFECKECGKKYKQSGTLTAHMRIHTGSKPYLCSICSRGFRQAPDLTYHMRTHTKEKPYMCNVCGKTMTMQCHLVQHMRSHTGEKPFKCSICDKAFPSSTRLKRHAIVHTTLKPYKCTTCSKSFNRNSSLKVHMKIHSDIKSHSCSLCHKSFLWAHSLRTHLQIHSKASQEITGGNNIIKSDKDSRASVANYSDEKLSTNKPFTIYSNGKGDSENNSILTYSTWD